MARQEITFYNSGIHGNLFPVTDPNAVTEVKDGFPRHMTAILTSGTKLDYDTTLEPIQFVKKSGAKFVTLSSDELEELWKKISAMSLLLVGPTKQHSWYLAQSENNVWAWSALCTRKEGPRWFSHYVGTICGPDEPVFVQLKDISGAVHSFELTPAGKVGTAATPAAVRPTRPMSTPFAFVTQDERKSAAGGSVVVSTPH